MLGWSDQSIAAGCSESVFACHTQGLLVAAMAGHFCLTCASACLCLDAAQAGRWLLNMAGVISDKEETQTTGAPEFPVAVRTQLLVGQISYAIQDQPAYAAAFTSMEGVPEADVQVQVRVALIQLSRAGKHFLHLQCCGQEGTGSAFVDARLATRRSLC